MTLPRTVLARVRRTPAPGAGDSRPLTGRLPDELLSEQVQRLAVFATVAAGVWAVGLFMDAVVMPAASGVRNGRALLIEVISLIVAGAMCVYLHRSGATPDHKANAGTAFMLANAAAIAGLSTWAALDPNRAPGVAVSWVAVLILVYSMIAPGSPRRMLASGLAAATLDPIALALFGVPGGATGSPLLTGVMLVWPNYVCAVIAVVPARVLHRIGRKLHEAQALGSYQLIEPLGTGGMGEVWRAEHHLLARQAAIKLVRPEVLGARDEQDARVMLRRFEREAQATAMLSSPHTIQLFDFGITQDGTFYYVMELLTGRDLESLVRDFGPLPANRVLYLLRQVCHSLADAHARGMVHRDIKPANIYACRMGLEYDFAKLLDFGLVKVTARGGARGDTLSTLEHTTTGTPAYMAPETILGDIEVDRRADVYAIGCVAYYLLTGQLVFEAETPMKMLLQHLHAPPVPPSQRTELPIPRELDELVLRCLEKDPDRRPQSAIELFRLACGCHSCEGWSREIAQHWWETHLPELTGPLAGPPPAAASPAAPLVTA